MTICVNFNAFWLNEIQNSPLTQLISLISNIVCYKFTLNISATFAFAFNEFSYMEIILASVIIIIGTAEVSTSTISFGYFGIYSSSCSPLVEQQKYYQNKYSFLRVQMPHC